MFFITDINMYKKLMPVDNACALIDKAAIDELLLSLSLADGMSCTGEVKYLSDVETRKVKGESNMFSAFMESELLNRLQDVWYAYLCLEFKSDEYTSETVHLFYRGGCKHLYVSKTGWRHLMATEVMKCAGPALLDAQVYETEYRDELPEVAQRISKDIVAFGFGQSLVVPAKDGECLRNAELFPAFAAGNEDTYMSWASIGGRESCAVSANDIIKNANDGNPMGVTYIYGGCDLCHTRISWDMKEVCAAEISKERTEAVLKLLNY